MKVFLLSPRSSCDVAPAYARGYVAQKRGGYEVVIRIDKNPPVLGDNQIEVEIRTLGKVEGC
jgi:hypothetical protein